MELRGLVVLLLATAASSTRNIHEDVVSLLQNAAQGALQPGTNKAANLRWQMSVGGSEEATPPTFQTGEAAEVKSQRFAGLGGWATCLIVKLGEEPNSYDVVIPGAAIMRSVPSLMLRKKRKATTPAPEVTSREMLPDLPPEEEVGNVDTRIDGEPGENVEILMRKGPRAGSWVAGSIAVAGKLPDTYDVRIPTEDGNFTMIANVPGNSMRKVDPSQILVTTEEVTYKVGDRVEVKHTPDSGSGKVIWVTGVIAAYGTRPNTFTIIAGSMGHLFDIPKSVLRPKPILEADLLRRNTEPVLTDSIFEVGEEVEARAVEGELAGLWLRARIAERGPVPFTYYVNMTQWKIEDLVGILTYHELLRRPGQVYNRAATTSFELGERIHFKHVTENSSRIWWNGIIVNKSKVADSYDIIGPNEKAIPSVPVELMRKVYFDEAKLPRVACREYRVGDTVEYKYLLTGTWLRANVTAESEVKGAYDLQDVLGQQLHWMFPELLRRPATSFQIGDAVEVEGHKNKSTIWTRSVVKSLGKYADTYNIDVEDVGLVESVHITKLRQADPVAQKDLLRAYEVGEKIEMLMLYGNDAGQWLGGKIASKGFIKYTYNLTVPGFGMLPDVPIETIRKVPSSRFKVGEFVKVRIQNGPSKGTWGMGLVSGVGSMPDSWNISFWKIGMVPNVPLQLIMKENKPWRIEDTPYFEVGAYVKVRDPTAADAGNFIAGTVVGQSMIRNSSLGPRPQLYTVSFPSHPELGDVPDMPAELLVRDEIAMRYVQYVQDVQVNDTVRLKGLIGPGGAPWVKMYIVRNGTKPGCYDVHHPGHGIFANQPVELIRPHGVVWPIPSFEVNQDVETFDLLDSTDNLWVPGKIQGPGIRPASYDVISVGGTVLLESVPAEAMRRVDGQDFRPLRRTYQEGEIVEVKDVLGIMSPSAKTKAVFRVISEGVMPNTFDIEGTHIGVIRNVPWVLFVKVNLEDVQAMSDLIEPGEFVECSDVDKPGSQGLCFIDSEGERPGTFNVRKMGYGGVFPNIPVTRLHKEQTQLLPELAFNISAKSRRVREPKVGDSIEVHDGEEWLEGTIKRKDDQANTFDVRAGDSRTLKNVPAGDIRFPKTDTEDGPTVQFTSTTGSLQADREDGPLQTGDYVYYLSPGANNGNSSARLQARVIGPGQVPSTYTIGLTSGFLMNNVPLTYLEKDVRFAITTTQPVDITNAWTNIALVLPTIKGFQAKMQKDYDESMRAWKGEVKAVLANDMSGKNLGDGTVKFAVGERAEVQILSGEKKGQWAQCLITGQGKWTNSYNIHLPDAPEEIRDLVNVGSKILRKPTLRDDPEAAKIRAASRCSDEERRLMRESLERDGPYNNNPEECAKVRILAKWGGISPDAAGECVQRKLSITANCSSCATDFTKEFATLDAYRRGCHRKCLAIVQACKNLESDGPNCYRQMGECLYCMKTPFISMLKCIGTADTSTPSKIDQLADACASGQLLAKGGLPSIFGSDWVTEHNALLQPIFGAALDDTSTEIAEEQHDSRQSAFQAGDKADLRITSGPHIGNWVECDITGKGLTPDTYNVHIPSAPQGKQDYKDVSSRVLRRSEASDNVDPAAATPPPTDEDPL